MISFVIELDRESGQRVEQAAMVALRHLRADLVVQLAKEVIHAFRETAPRESTTDVPPNSAFSYWLVQNDEVRTVAEVYLDPRYKHLLAVTQGSGPYIIRGDPLHWVDRATGEERYAQWVIHPGHRSRDWPKLAAERYGPAAQLTVRKLAKQLISQTSTPR